jgi:DNA-binding PadR family transcriptional regulator
MAIDPADLTPTALTILGFLEGSPRSGYEIKQAVDGSTTSSGE